MEQEAKSSRMMDILSKVALKRVFKNRFLPNLILTGWRGWWPRMEAEGRKDEGKQKHNQERIRSRIKTNKAARGNFISKHLWSSQLKVGKYSTLMESRAREILENF